MESTDTTKLTLQPAELFGQIVRLTQTVEQNTKELRELTGMMRGDGMNTGLIIEHERIKNKIDYNNPKSIDDRMCDLERLVGAGKWLFLLVMGTAIINLLVFLGDLITHQAQIIHP